MGLFSRTPKPFVSDAAFRSNLARQLKMTPSTLGQLRGYGVGEDRALKLEFFFYTDAAPKAKGLAAALSALGYETKHGLSGEPKRTHIVTGWTTPIPMTEPDTARWVQRMCELGFEHDAEFDGWGTNPNQ